MAFDGTHLYYTIEGDTNIYKITTAGAHVATIPVAGGVSAGGPLAWDGSALWTIDYGPTHIMYRVDPADGSILSSCDIAAVNPGHPALSGLAFPDGLDWTGSQLVLSGEIYPGYTTALMNPDCTITSSFANPVDQGAPGYATSGVTFDGVNLWHTTVADEAITKMLFFQTDLAGNVLPTSFVANRPIEDHAYDTVTFAPDCVIWGNEATGGPNHIEAYEVPCGTELTPTPPAPPTNTPVPPTPTPVITPQSVGGISLDPQPPGSSGGDAGLLVGAMAAALTGAIALGSAAWYARRRRVP